jgi:hypothetical protein
MYLKGFRLLERLLVKLGEQSLYKVIIVSLGYRELLL